MKDSALLPLKGTNPTLRLVSIMNAQKELSMKNDVDVRCKKEHVCACAFSCDQECI